MIRVTIHQPEHLPWIGYFNKVSKSDILVHLDNVQFEKNNFQNRNRICNNGITNWITVPVSLKDHTKKDISQIEINNHIEWRKKYLNTLYHTYCRCPFFKPYYDAIAQIILQDEQYICDLNMNLLSYLFQILDIKTHVVKASDVVETYGGKDNLLNICRELGAKCYLSGQFGRNYLDIRKFEDVGIEVEFNDYQHPVYEQRGQDQFVSHMSIVDLLFNCGTQSAKRIIMNG